MTPDGMSLSSLIMASPALALASALRLTLTPGRDARITPRRVTPTLRGGGGRSRRPGEARRAAGLDARNRGDPQAPGGGAGHGRPAEGGTAAGIRPAHRARAHRAPGRRRH